MGSPQVKRQKKEKDWGETQWSPSEKAEKDQDWEEAQNQKESQFFQGWHLMKSLFFYPRNLSIVVLNLYLTNMTNLHSLFSYPYPAGDTAGKYNALASKQAIKVYSEVMKVKYR